MLVGVWGSRHGPLECVCGINPLYMLFFLYVNAPTLHTTRDTTSRSALDAARRRVPERGLIVNTGGEV